MKGAHNGNNHYSNSHSHNGGAVLFGAEPLFHKNCHKQGSQGKFHSLIIDALIDLTNGNYLGEGVTDSMQKIKIKELSSLQAAFEEILKLSGVALTNAEIAEVIKKANELKISDYLVHGDLDWKDIDPKIKERNEANARDILGSQSDYGKYSLYTVQLAKLLKDAYAQTNPKKSLDEGFKAFAEKYDKNTVLANTEGFKRIEDPVTAMKKNGYAERDLKVALKMAVKQAEFKSGKPIENKETIMEALTV